MGLDQEILALICVGLAFSFLGYRIFVRWGSLPLAHLFLARGRVKWAMCLKNLKSVHQSSCSQCHCESRSEDQGKIQGMNPGKNHGNQ